MEKEIEILEDLSLFDDNPVDGHDSGEKDDLLLIRCRQLSREWETELLPDEEIG